MGPRSFGVAALVRFGLNWIVCECKVMNQFRRELE